MADNIRSRWTYNTKEAAVSTAITRDGRFIFAGDEGGFLYCFERSGHLLWRTSVEGIPFSFALAEGSERLLVGCTTGKAYLFSYGGTLLRVLQSSGFVWSVAITPSAHRLVLGTVDHILALFNETGTLLWQRTLDDKVRRLTITPDGNTIVLGCDDYSVYCFNASETLLWRSPTAGPVLAGVQSTPTASCIVAGSADRHVHFLDRAGQVRWRYNADDAVATVALTPDGRFIAAAGYNQAVIVLNQSGELRWRATMGQDIFGLVLSRDGRFVAASTHKGLVSLFSQDGMSQNGTVLWTQAMQGAIYAIAMTPNGRFISIASEDTRQSVSLIENTLAPENMSEARFAYTLIPAIRRTYSANPHQGLASWFDTFDLALLQNELDLCTALLRELRGGPYALLEHEQKVVESREGTLLLYLGMQHQQRGELAQAKQAYERSREIHHQQNYHEGEGQAIAALQSLESGKGENDPILLSLLLTPPSVMDSSETVLSKRLAHVSESEQHQIVLAAQQQGYSTTLITALSSPSDLVRTAASTALERLRPGPSIETLLDLFASQQWIVRWQACRMLLWHVQHDAMNIAAYRERIRTMLLERLKQEQDPLVLSDLALLARGLDDATQVPALLSLIEDADPDVRIEAVAALGQVATRHELKNLRQVADGRSWEGVSIDDLATAARHIIRQRTPLAQVQSVIYSSELTTPRPSHSTTLFLTYNPVIHCIISLTRPTAGLKIQCTISTLNKQEPMQQEQQLGIPTLDQGVSQDTHRSVRDWLYRLLAEEDEIFWTWREDEEDIEKADSTRDDSTEVVFTFAPQRGTWFPGIYTAAVTINGEVQYRQLFKVTQREAILAAPAHYKKGLLFHEARRYQDALVSYEQSLEFDAAYTHAWCNKGDVLISRGQLAEASDAYKQAIELDPNTTLAHFCANGLLHLLEHNRIEEVLAAISQALVLSLDSQIPNGQNSVLVHFLTVVEALLLEDKTRANTILESTTQLVPVSMLDSLAIILAFILLKRKEEAMAALETAKHLVMPSILSTLVQAVSFALLNKGDTALSLLDQELYKTPTSIVLHIAKALVQLQLRHEEEALVLLNDALRIHPGLIALYILKGYVLSTLHRNDEVLETAEQVLRFNPDLALAHVLKSVALTVSKHYDDALASTQLALASDPSMLLASIVTVYIFSAQQKISEAIAASEPIVQQVPESAFVQFVYGELLLRGEKDEAALRAFEHATLLGLDSPLLHDKKARARSRLK